MRALIARAILGEQMKNPTLGQLTLHDHQLSAVRRITHALERFNGALLCDEVGMGKTYVAVAVAREFSDWLVVAPAALLPMWKAALARAESRAEVVTLESLSRADQDAFRGRRQLRQSYDLVVVDEAHHVRNPRTNRYFALERLVRGAGVLLLSATPIHNRRNDLVALLSLFLGSRATTMTASELAQCVIRREQSQLDDALPLPIVRAVVAHSVGDDPTIVEALMNLPPPVPARDAGVGGALIGRGLVHQWASSEAAFREALRRRIARATALCTSLEAGRYPTLKELESWVYGEGALQLGFAELLSSPTPDHSALLNTVRAHLDALHAIRQNFTSTPLDGERAQVLTAIRDSRPGAKIVAFSQYAETISMLYRRLVRHGYVAMLTSRGAQVAGGALTRGEAVSRFAPAATGSMRPSRAEEIHLLLTTDLLSEGVNLQDADTVIHLDNPWTAARMEQRVGRVARLGSVHRYVEVHAIRPPASAEALLRSEPTIERKRTVARVEETTPRKVERLRDLLTAWLPRSVTPIPDDSTVIAAAASDETAFIAAVTLDGAEHLIVGDARGATTAIDDQLRVCDLPVLSKRKPGRREILHALRSIHGWCTAQRAASAAGVIDSRASGRRELIMRIDAAIEKAPPHRRRARLELAARARQIVTRPQCADVERELTTIVHSGLPDEEWLAAIANLETQQAIRFNADESVRIHALLLLRRPRSPRLRDRESP